MTTTRTPNAHGELGEERPLADVSSPHDQMLVWDLADNLIAVEDLRDPTEWPEGYRPQSVHVTHDSLYRVAGAEYEYTADDGSRTSVDEGLDWRDEMAATCPNDPMRTDPAPMATTPPDDRKVSMTWAYDWLGNMQSWDDDASAFYERSLGDIVNGADLTTPGPRRPGALYVASNLPSAPDPMGTLDQGGWLEVRYGEDGNALALTVHAQCSDPSLNDLPLACRTAGHAEAIALSCAWSCASEQHYTYAWDEVNRIAEARRFDRHHAGAWSLAVQQRYLYDSANQRTVKSTSFRDEEAVISRTALYVYPGAFARRGLVVGFGQEGPTYQASAGDTETQYVVGGARIAWRSDRDGMGIDRNQRITIGLTDLIQSTTAVLDLASGELVETGSYYANGARETYRASSNGDRVAAEPMGFTGKEADEEVGLTYFGQRYLMSHLGRWASPDPLQTHAVGGGEAINGYHYVAGNVLSARDPNGLDGRVEVRETESGTEVVMVIDVVVSAATPERQAVVMASMCRQRDYVNSLRFEVNSDALGLSGPERNVIARVEMRVREASEEEREEIEIAIRRDDPTEPTHGPEGDRQLSDAQEASVSRYARAHGFNVVLGDSAGTVRNDDGTTRPSRSAVSGGNVLFYRRGSVGDDASGARVGAHETLHLGGARDGYVRDSAEPRTGYSRGDLMFDGGANVDFFRDLYGGFAAGLSSARSGGLPVATPNGAQFTGSEPATAPSEP